MSLATGGALSLVSSSPFGYSSGDLWLQLALLGRSRDVSTMAVQLITSQGPSAGTGGGAPDEPMGPSAGWAAGDPRLNPYLLLSALSTIQPTGAHAQRLASLRLLGSLISRLIPSERDSTTDSDELPFLEAWVMQLTLLSVR